MNYIMQNWVQYWKIKLSQKKKKKDKIVSEEKKKQDYKLIVSGF